MLISYVLHVTPEERHLICVANKSLEGHTDLMSELAHRYLGKWRFKPDSTILGYYVVQEESGYAIATEAAPTHAPDELYFYE